MGLKNYIKKMFNSVISTGTITNAGLSDDQAFNHILGVIWQTDYALSVVTNILANILVNTEWKTYKSGEPIVGEEWYRINYSPNKRESTQEFYGKLAYQLIHERRALIIETASGDLYVADQFSFKYGEEKVMEENVFVNVTLGSAVLNRTFKENKNCIYIKLPALKGVDTVLNEMSNDFKDLKTMVDYGARMASGQKYDLHTEGAGSNKVDAKYMEKLQERFLPLMEKPNAVFLTLKGEKLTDLTEKQRGSEVEQVLQAVDNNIRINKEILADVGCVFGIPLVFMTGEYTQENDSAYQMLVTMFVKPILIGISKKYSLFFLEKADILNGSKITADLNSIEFINALSLASSIDKLIASGAYLANEVRQMLGDGPIEGGDVRLISKNYAPSEELLKGGEESGQENKV